MQTTYPLLIDLTFILLHLVLFILNYKLYKKMMQPAVLFSFVWFCVLFYHFISRFTFLPDLFELGTESYFVFLTGVLCFSLGCFITTVICGQKKQPEIIVNKSVHINFWLRSSFLAIIVIGLPFYIKAAYQLFILSKVDDFFAGLRTEISYGDTDFGPLKYLMTFAFVVFAINLIAYQTKRNTLNLLMLILSLIVTLVYAVFATGRTFYLIILVLFLGINFLYNKKFSLRKYAWLLLVFIAIFMGIGIMYGKGGNKEDSLKNSISESLEVTSNYFVASLSAFDLELKQNNDINYTGDNSLRFFILIGQKLNLVPQKKAPELVKSFVFVPYSTNVYSYYSPYISDFGKLYAWIMLGLFGALHTWLYHKAERTKKLRYSLYFSFMLYPLVLSFFQDQYLSLLSTWLQIIFFTEFFIFLNQLLSKNDRYSNSKLE